MASYHQRNRGLIYYAGSNFFPLKEVIKLFFYYLCLIGGRNFAKIIQYGNGDQFFFASVSGFHFPDGLAQFRVSLGGGDALKRAVI